MNSLHHSAHATHTAHAAHSTHASHAAGWWIFLDLCDDSLGSCQEGSDAAGVGQGASNNLLGEIKTIVLKFGSGIWNSLNKTN